MKLVSPLIIAAISLSVLSCKKEEIIDIRYLSGGKNGTVFDVSENAFGHQMPGLPDHESLLFFVGNSFFNQNWVSAPASAKARDGVGPLFNAKSCSACHFKDGRGEPFLEAGDNANGFLIRLSVGENSNGGPLGDPVYGGQFNDKAILGVNHEGTINVIYEYVNGQYADGTPYQLRKPIYSFSDLNYGPMASNVMMSPRIGQQMIGLGLLEAILEADLYSHIDEADADGDGISGRANYVWDINANTLRLGRFGWKANQPSLTQQVAGAFHGDLGIKSSLFPNENHTENQPECNGLDDGGTIEIEDDDLQKTVLYSSTLAVPARRNIDAPNVMAGEILFKELKCVVCHVQTFETGNGHSISHLNNQTIHPYTDLLLHDMGEDLADHRPDFLATGNEWRTQPLWGIGLIQTVNGHTFFLHDGRARSIEEAILWHGGEAENSKEKFKALSSEKRQFVIDFINSL